MPSAVAAVAAAAVAADTAAAQASAVEAAVSRAAAVVPVFRAVAAVRAPAAAAVFRAAVAPVPAAVLAAVPVVAAVRCRQVAVVVSPAAGQALARMAVREAIAPKESAPTAPCVPAPVAYPTKCAAVVECVKAARITMSPAEACAEQATALEVCRPMAAPTA